jgi:hypothetical protein
LPLPVREARTDRVLFALPPDLTRHLAAGSNVGLRLSLDGETTFDQTTLAWPAMAVATAGASARASGLVSDLAMAPPEPLTAPASQRGPTPTAVATATIATPPPLPPQQPRRGTARWVLAASALVAVALGLGLGWYLGTRPNLASKPPAAEALPASRAQVRDYLAGKPAVVEARRRADALLQQGHADAAFLVYRFAAEGGDNDAALAIGKMYDPDTYDPKTSPLPAANAEEAASWYHQAAEAGLVEAERRLGKLLLKGNTNVAADAEKGAFWLRKAADQGDADAAAALETIR